MRILLITVLWTWLSIQLLSTVHCGQSNAWSIYCESRKRVSSPRPVPHIASSTHRFRTERGAEQVIDVGGEVSAGVELKNKKLTKYQKWHNNSGLLRRGLVKSESKFPVYFILEWLQEYCKKKLRNTFQTLVLEWDLNFLNGSDQKWCEGWSGVLEYWVGFVHQGHTP